METALFWKLFALQFHRISTVTERARGYAEEMRKHGDRQHRTIEAAFSGPCAGCPYPVRRGEKVCYMPATTDRRAIVFHWVCAPRYIVGTPDELALARRLYAADLAL